MPAFEPTASTALLKSFSVQLNSRDQNLSSLLGNVHAPVILGTRDFGRRRIEAELRPLVVGGRRPAGRKVVVAVVVHVATILPIRPAD